MLLKNISRIFFYFFFLNIFYRRSPRINKENKPILHNVQPVPLSNDDSFADETIITGPAFSAGRRKVREMVDNQPDSMNEKEENTSVVQPEMNSSSDMIISNSILQDVTNTVKRRRKSMHKETIEETASPTLCRKSLEEKEKEEVKLLNELKRWGKKSILAKINGFLKKNSSEGSPKARRFGVKTKFQKTSILVLEVIV